MAGKGCADWETAKIGNLLTFSTEAESTLQCTDNPSCAFSNFQPGDCSDAEGAYKGACYLFSTCTEENNTCWDLTPKSCTASTTTTTGRRAPLRTEAVIWRDLLRQRLAMCFLSRLVLVLGRPRPGSVHRGGVDQIVVVTMLRTVVDREHRLSQQLIPSLGI